MSGLIADAINKIKEQTEDLKDNEVEEIALDSIHFGQINTELKKHLEKYENLFSLSLNDCALTSLDNFPNIAKIVRLELMDNKLNGKHLKSLTHFEELQSLSLGGNDIKTFEDLEPLKQIKKLFQLDLFNCELSKLDKYREKIFEIFPNLGILDNLDKDGQEVDYEDDEVGEDEDEDYEEEDDNDEDEEYNGEEEEEEEEKPLTKKVKKN